MRRLLVKRFESSFGAFSQSIDRFLSVHLLVKDFIEKSDGKYILDRGLIDKIKSYDEDEIDRVLSEYSKDLLNKKIPKNLTAFGVFVPRTSYFLSPASTTLPSTYDRPTILPKQ